MFIHTAGDSAENILSSVLQKNTRFDLDIPYKKVTKIVVECCSRDIAYLDGKRIFSPETFAVNIYVRDSCYPFYTAGRYYSKKYAYIARERLEQDFKYGCTHHIMSTENAVVASSRVYDSITDKSYTEGTVFFSHKSEFFKPSDYGSKKWGGLFDAIDD